MYQKYGNNFVCVCLSNWLQPKMIEHLIYAMLIIVNHWQLNTFSMDYIHAKDNI